MAVRITFICDRCGHIAKPILIHAGRQIPYRGNAAWHCGCSETHQWERLTPNQKLVYRTIQRMHKQTGQYPSAHAVHRELGWKTWNLWRYLIQLERRNFIGRDDRTWRKIIPIVDIPISEEVPDDGTPVQQ